MEDLAKVRQVTRAAACLECGKCTTMCPLAAWGDLSARVVTAHDRREDDQKRGSVVRRCLTCGSCELRCPQDVRFAELVRMRREAAFHEGPEPECPHGGALQSMMRIMATNEAQPSRLGWLDDELKTDPKKGGVFYWTGCAPFYDVYFSELKVGTLGGIRSAVLLMNKLGVTPVVSPNERCCGHDLLWNGDREHFELLAKRNTELVADSGAETLVTSCAECLRTWKTDYAPFFKGAAPRIMHITEFLDERLPELKLNSGKGRRVTFQDPCRLGRHLGIYEPPRKVLGALPGVELVEMRRSGPSSICCAGGVWSYCDGSAKLIQVQRLKEARATGADLLVTACPKCQIHFRCAMKDPKLEAEIEIEMRDVAELVAEALV